MGHYALWLAPFGWGIFFIGLIIAIVLFAIKRKFYPVMYLVSIATYIFTIGFVIDAFDLSKNWVLLLLAISSVIFILVGLYISHKFNSIKERFENSIPSRKIRN